MLSTTTSAARIKIAKKAILHCHWRKPGWQERCFGTVGRWKWEHQVLGNCIEQPEKSRYRGYFIACTDNLTGFDTYIIHQLNNKYAFYKDLRPLWPIWRQDLCRCRWTRPEYFGRFWGTSEQEILLCDSHHINEDVLERAIRAVFDDLDDLLGITEGNYEEVYYIELE